MPRTFRFVRTAALAALSAAVIAAQPRFVVGVCTHFSQGKGILEANLSLIRQSGASSIRDEVPWGAVEREKQEYSMPPSWYLYVDRAVQSGIEPLLILDYGNRFYDNRDKPVSAEAVEAFTRYAEFVVGHFKGKVRLYEVWNEWDIAIGGTTAGSAEDYAKLLKAVYPRIKKIDPSITVMGGCPTSGGIKKGWLDRMLASDVLGSLDAVSIHTYNYSGQGRARTPEAWAEFVAAAEASIRKQNGGRDVPLYVTEMGWPTHVGARGTSREQSAEFLARTFLLARTMPYLKGLWWYDFQDDGWKPEHNEDNFGLVRPDVTPKPAFFALSSVASAVINADFVGRLETEAPDLWVLKFRWPSGDDLLALWSDGPDERRVVVRSGRAPESRVRVTETGRVTIEPSWRSRDWTKPGSTLTTDRISISVRENPILVTGEDLSLVPAPH